MRLLAVVSAQGVRERRFEDAWATEPPDVRGRENRTLRTRSAGAPECLSDGGERLKPERCRRALRTHPLSGQLRLRDRRRGPTTSLRAPSAWRSRTRSDRSQQRCPQLTQAALREQAGQSAAAHRRLSQHSGRHSGRRRRRCGVLAYDCRPDHRAELIRHAAQIDARHGVARPVVDAGTGVGEPVQR